MKRGLTRARAKLIPAPLYAGPAVPTAYDPKWQSLTNLTKAQIEAFQSFPEWQQKLVALAK